MFTGIIESLGTVKNLVADNDNLHITIEASIASELNIDESVAHNGVCLTVTSVTENTYTVTAIAETLAKTNLGKWKIQDAVNLEQAMVLGSRLDGHIVQGHVDCITTCTKVEEQNGSWLYEFALPQEHAALIIEKGSICINGTSLTCFNISKNSFCVAIIPYTYAHTNFQYLQQGSVVNLEFDILGKYIQRWMSLK
jgi:riboflavin synthase